MSIIRQNTATALLCALLALAGYQRATRSRPRRHRGRRAPPQRLYRNIQRRLGLPIHCRAGSLRPSRTRVPDGHKACRDYIVSSLRSFDADTVIVQKASVTAYRRHPTAYSQYLRRVQHRPKQARASGRSLGYTPWADREDNDSTRNIPIPRRKRRRQRCGSAARDCPQPCAQKAVRWCRPALRRCRRLWPQRRLRPPRRHMVPRLAVLGREYGAVLARKPPRIRYSPRYGRRTQRALPLRGLFRTKRKQPHNQGMERGRGLWATATALSAKWEEPLSTTT